MIYKCSKPFRHEGETYMTGDSIDLDETTADKFVERNMIEDDARKLTATEKKKAEAEAKAAAKKKEEDEAAAIAKKKKSEAEAAKIKKEAEKQSEIDAKKVK